MRAGTILACRDARAAHWQLGPLPPAHGRLTLLAWTTSTSALEGGIPSEVALVLARSWTALARVTFPSSALAMAATDAWSDSPDGLVRALGGRGFIDRTRSRLRGMPANAALMSTRSPAVATRLFDDAGFPWWMQGQTVLLSDPEAAPPDVDERALAALVEDDWAQHAAGLSTIGVHAVVRPGVDGDVAGVLAFDDAFDTRVRDSLAREARQAEMGFAIVAEEALLDSTAGDARG